MTCAQCGNPVPVDGPSPDFCAYECQRMWHGAQAEHPVTPDTLTLIKIVELTRKTETPHPTLISNPF